jgi:hypothetical protein
VLGATLGSSAALAQQAAPPSPWGAPPVLWPGAAPAPGAAPGGVGAAGGGGAYGPSATARQLDEAEREDSGRGLEWFWLQAEGGAQYVGLDAIAGSRLLLPGQDGSGAAPVAGLAAGGRLLFFTAGVRARAAFLPVGQLGTLNLEGGYHVPLGNWEPYVHVGAGYARLLGVDRPAVATEAPSVQGVDARLAGGADYYLAPQFSLGLMASVEALWLWRAGVTPRAEAVASEDPATQRAAREAGRDARGAGVAAGLNLVAGLHF